MARIAREIMKRTRVTAIFAVLALTMALSTSAAMAEHGGSPPIDPPAAAECTGTGTTSPIEAPVIDGNIPVVNDGPDFTWELNTNCDIGVDSSPDVHQNVPLVLDGTGQGWCGLWGGTSSSGHLGAQHLDNMTWTGVGGVWIVTFSHDAGGLGVGYAVVQVSGGADCATGGATSFDVTIVLYLH